MGCHAMEESMRTRLRGHRLRGASFAAIALVGLGSIGCDDTGKPDPRATFGLEACGATNIFYRGNFSNPSVIDSRWLPLIPGTQLILDGEANRTGQLLPHRVIFTVTDLTKVIDGIPTRVVWDRDYNAGQIQEAELAFFAQDDDGNVWSMGEYPEEYENGEFLAAPSVWIAGLGTAQAGISAPGSTQLGYRFLQGWVPDVDFLDCGTVFSTGGRTCVPLNCYENVMVTDEFSPLAQAEGHQRKYYAPGVGIVRVGAVDDPEGETLVLTNVLQLDARGLEEARLEALRLEARAYEINEVYRQTAPMQRVR
jgi:hypothetical protein